MDRDIMLLQTLPGIFALIFLFIFFSLIPSFLYWYISFRFFYDYWVIYVKPEVCWWIIIRAEIFWLIISLVVIEYKRRKYNKMKIN